MRRKSIGRRLQAVVHMNGMHLLRPTQSTSDQQSGGIGAATERNGERYAVRQRIERGEISERRLWCR